MVDENFFLEYGLNVSRETFDRLKIFHDVLLFWNKKHNLISQATVSQVWTRHILDSIQLTKFIPKESQKIVDLGSGAGFPGLVIAMATGLCVVLVEANTKKSFFLKEVQRILNLDVMILSQRIETLSSLKVDLITSRALATLGNLCTFASYHLNSAGKSLFLKGEQIDLEIQEAQQYWCFDFIKHPSLSNPKGIVLEVTNIIRK